MKLSLTRKLSSSEKMTIGSESSKNLRTSFKRMVYESRKNYSKVKKSSSFRQLLREQKEYISNSSLDNFIEGGNTYDDFDVPVDRIPGVNDLQSELFYKEGISRVSDLIDVFFNMEGSGTCDSYTNFKEWLVNIGIVDEKDMITMCMSSKWYLMVAKDNNKGTTVVKNHGVYNVCGIITIGMCSCLMMF